MSRARAARGVGQCARALVIGSGGEGGQRDDGGTGPHPQLRARALGGGRRGGSAAAQSGHRGGPGHRFDARRRSRCGAPSRPRGGRQEPAPAGICRAGAGAQGTGRAHPRAPRRAARDRHAQRRQHQGRREVRRRRREQLAAFLCRAGRHPGRRRRAGGRRRGGALAQHAALGPACLAAAARRRRADQRLQLPGLGARREARLRLPGRHAGGGQAGDPDRAARLPHRRAVRGERPAAGGELELPGRPGG